MEPEQAPRVLVVDDDDGLQAAQAAGSPGVAPGAGALALKRGQAARDAGAL